ncbi:adhesin biosynthesis transcription regulatory family protein [Shewanella acanthi]|nr:adhesin biosynthesis transcription regulatory family protein [Shewanella acanthi]
MLYLLPGSESEAKINALLSLTRITSEPTIEAMKLHLTTALEEERCAARHGIEPSNLNRNLGILNKTMATVETIKEMDWQRFITRNETRVKQLLAELAAANARIAELETELAIQSKSYQLTDSCFEKKDQHYKKEQAA